MCQDRSAKLAQTDPRLCEQIGIFGTASVINNDDGAKFFFFHGLKKTQHSVIGFISRNNDGCHVWSTPFK